MNYLPVFVYKGPLGDCSANGISKTHSDKLVVPCEDGYITDQDLLESDYIVLELEQRTVNYKCFKMRGDERWLMNGGNFAYTSDSRFSAKYGTQPIAIHDRYEG